MLYVDHSLKGFAHFSELACIGNPALFELLSATPPVKRRDRLLNGVVSVAEIPMQFIRDSVEFTQECLECLLVTHCEGDEPAWCFEGFRSLRNSLQHRSRVAHFVAQNAHHQTDTGVPVRHTSLNPRALAVQTDVLDRFLCFDSPQLHKTNDWREA